MEKDLIENLFRNAYVCPSDGAPYRNVEIAATSPRPVVTDLVGSDLPNYYGTIIRMADKVQGRLSSYSGDNYVENNVQYYSSEPRYSTNLIVNQDYMLKFPQNKIPKNLEVCKERLAGKKCESYVD